MNADMGKPASGDDPSFKNWGASERDLSVFDRVLISVLAVSYAQASAPKDLDDYLASLNPEVKQAFLERADNILHSHNKGVLMSAKETDARSTWVEAIKFGVQTNLDDFANSQTQSFRSLDAFVRERTSYKSQAISAFLVALALSIFVGLVRPAVTLFDDIRADFSRHASALKEPNGDPQHTSARQENSPHP
jgi:hypothetical protein